MPQEALGLIEARNLHAAMEASAAATSAAPVSASVELIDAAFVVIKIEGELNAVQAAVDAGAHAAQRAGKLIAARIIPRTLDGNGAQPVARRRSTPAPQRKAKAKVNRTPSATPTRLEPAAPVSSAAPVLSAAVPAPLVASGAPAPMLSLTELEEMPVVKLRQYARTVPDLPIQGRQISAANKQQLLEAIKSVR